MTHVSYTVLEEHTQLRLDQYLHQMHPAYSRTQCKKAIESSRVQVNSAVVTRAKHRVMLGDIICFEPQSNIDLTQWCPTSMPLNILFEDEHICVINKPANLIMHPGAGIHTHTLANALLAKDPNTQKLPRAGIIHRLDKNTSGCCITVRSLPAYQHLIAQMEAREIHRHYTALVHGQIQLPNTIDAPIGRDPKRRTAMAVVAAGRHARTHYTPITHYPKHTHLNIQLETGRTHQIRVHMKHIKHPIVGDPTYTTYRSPPTTYPASAQQALANYPYQALHAYRIEFEHPITQALLCFEAPLPKLFQTLLDTLSPIENQDF